jgi:Glycosyl hydrolases family 2, sugar binding domain/Glycosyl hydrolases family 2/Glycosyl hydrolases family 2, TIM barrel domain
MDYYKLIFKMKFLLLLIVFSGFCLSEAHSQNITPKVDFSGVFAPSEGMIKDIEKPFREEICLNGRWDFQGVEVPNGWVSGKGIAPELTKPDDSKWDKVKIKIPSPWNANSFVRGDGPDHNDFPSYPESWDRIRMAWMRKQVEIPSNWAGKQLILHFEAVAGFTEVYVNGKKVCENFDLFLPFETDITHYITPGQKAEILVGVRKMELFNDNSTIGRRIIPGGSMWGSHIGGIWQDVYLWALPVIRIKEVFVKPLVSKGTLELEIIVNNSSGKDAKLNLTGDINEWLNLAGKDMISAPVPNWKLGKLAIRIPVSEIKLKANSEQKITLRVPVTKELELWTPKSPNLYGLTLSLNKGKTKTDVKYERFGWREWTFKGDKQLLNGEVMELHGDSWHFMGIPQMTRRYAWSWFTALKEANGNAIRPHAQVYPRFYLDVADEMGVCILDETAIWASDGGPKFDSDVFWKYCEDHLKRLVLRDRNHASVFGWSTSNENKPVILNVMRRPDLMEKQKAAWVKWRDICMTNDPTRPWISSDGEEDGEGVLPTVVGHYGDQRALENWSKYGKPWGVGEHGMAYYGSAPQVSKYNGERAYESFLGRMEGLAYEAYNLISLQRKYGASYTSVFNIAWYGLEPLPLGMADISKKPEQTNGIFFTTPYQEGKPGVQPERLGPYCTTFNPGYDPNLPLYKPWPMFDAIKAANAPGGPAQSKWDKMPDLTKSEPAVLQVPAEQVVFIGEDNSLFKSLCEAEGVTFSTNKKLSDKTVALLDGKGKLSPANIEMVQKVLAAGGEVFIWELIPDALPFINQVLPASLELVNRTSSSLIVKNAGPLTSKLYNSDLYFSEIQRTPILAYGMDGPFLKTSTTIIEACNTDWGRWNGHAEAIKTGSVLRGEREAKNSGVAVAETAAGKGKIIISTITNLMATDKGEQIFVQLIKNLGIRLGNKKFMSGEGVFNQSGYLTSALVSPKFGSTTMMESLQTDWLKDESTASPKENDKSSAVVWKKMEADTAYLFNFNKVRTNESNENSAVYLSFWIWSPRALDDLLVEPDMPKLDLIARADDACRIWINGKPLNDNSRTTRARRPGGEVNFQALQLTRGWNHFLVKIAQSNGNWEFSGRLKCTDLRYLAQLKSALVSPDQK